MDQAGRVALVTGGGQGIGEGIARSLGSCGATVVVADVEAGKASEVAASITSGGHQAAGVALDVKDSAQVDDVVATIADRWGPVDILVNCAGVVCSDLVVEMAEEDWRNVVDVNLTGSFLCAKAVLPGMIANHWGRIVNVASIAAKRISYNGGACYTASKAGLLGFTRHLAYEVAGDGVTVNAICPGPTLTPLASRFWSEEEIQERSRDIPAGRIAAVKDQVAAVRFLVSEEAALVQGQAIDVDGGALLGWQPREAYLQRRRRGAGRS